MRKVPPEFKDLKVPRPSFPTIYEWLTFLGFLGGMLFIVDRYL